MLFILITALLITTYVIFTRPDKPDFSQSDTPVYDQLAKERGFTKWDV